ncbi:hypothetical protein MMC14_010342 [Varicellaria rhodocarpa]|nr:hypothetical protein [Varicellaria rhodocarpa]
MTWKSMERLVDNGKTKSISKATDQQPQPNSFPITSPEPIYLLVKGVSNFSAPKLKRLLSTARVHPAVNQIELNPYFPQKDLFNFCKASDIHVTAFGPLGCTPIPALVGRRGPGPLEDATEDAKIGELT